MNSTSRAESIDKKITKRMRCRYLLYLPTGYKRGGRRWPLVLFLHGAGERGDDLEQVKTHGIPKLIEAGQKFPFIAVAPQCPKGVWWDNETLLTLLDSIQKRYRVDPDRVYLTGLSMGGYGTWLLALQAAERFAAIAPICGGGIPYLAPRLQHTPTWVFHGDRDECVPLQDSELMVDGLRRCGGNVQFTVYRDTGHDAWTATYANPKFYGWLLKQRRSKRARKMRVVM